MEKEAPLSIANVMIFCSNASRESASRGRRSRTGAGFGLPQVRAEPGETEVRRSDEPPV